LNNVTGVGDNGKLEKRVKAAVKGKFSSLVGFRRSRRYEVATKGSAAQPFDCQAVPGGRREAAFWIGRLQKAEWGVVETGSEEDFLL